MQAAFSAAVGAAAGTERMEAANGERLRMHDA
jgi:hypothetical protein